MFCENCQDPTDFPNNGIVAHRMSAFGVSIQTTHQRDYAATDDISFSGAAVVPPRPP